MAMPVSPDFGKLRENLPGSEEDSQRDSVHDTGDWAYTQNAWGRVASAIGFRMRTYRVIFDTVPPGGHAKVLHKFKLPLSVLG